MEEFLAHLSFTKMIDLLLLLNWPELVYSRPEVIAQPTRSSPPPPQIAAPHPMLVCQSKVGHIATEAR